MKNKNLAAQEMARLRHIKSPKPREFYKEISKKGVLQRALNKKKYETNVDASSERSCK